MTGCRLAVNCDGAPTALLAVARRPGGELAYMTVVPAAHGRGGLPTCARHVHTLIDNLLMDGLGPATPPPVEMLGGQP